MDKRIGIMRPRPQRETKPDRPAAKAAVEGDLGSPPTLTKLMATKLNPEDVAGDHNAELEGDLAKSAVVVNGLKVVLSTIRTQEHAGLLLAEATNEQMTATAHYRAWRARLGLEVVTKAKKDVPEWRVRQLIESEPDYLTYQQGMARAAANVLALRAVWETWGDD